MDAQNQLSPYSVLGLPENASSGQIHCTYKALIRLVHPDRANRTVNGVGLLRWTKAERENAFDEITKAYRTILSQRRESRDYPDDYVDVSEFDYEARGISEEFTVPQEFETFDLNRFNAAFESQNKIDQKHGYSCSLLSSSGCDDWKTEEDGSFSREEDPRKREIDLWRGNERHSETIASMALIDEGDNCTVKVPLGGKDKIVGSDVRDSFVSSCLSPEALNSEKVGPLSAEEIENRIKKYSSVEFVISENQKECPVLEEARNIDQARYQKQKAQDEYYSRRKLLLV